VDPVIEGLGELLTYHHAVVADADEDGAATFGVAEGDHAALEGTLPGAGLQLEVLGLATNEPGESLGVDDVGQVHGGTMDELCTNFKQYRRKRSQTFVITRS
jgi:hypothetical protein